jgi:branched-chain amino acid transport system ATP-binding protein
VVGKIEADNAEAGVVLDVNNMEVVYDDVVLVLRGVNISIRNGEIVALLGANGAGKTTTLKAISGLLGSEQGKITRGTIKLFGEKIARLGPEAIVRRGVFQVMEGRRIVEDMTVLENLRLGAFTQGKGAEKLRLEEVLEYFPRLRERARGLAGYLSGGEQQMLAIGRALMARPRVLLLDEPSMGLSPRLVEEVFGIIRDINREEGLTMLLVEQNANWALRTADYGYVMENGKVVLDGSSERLISDENVKNSYLGAGEYRRSFKDIKSYRRRKRWV